MSMTRQVMITESQRDELLANWQRGVDLAEAGRDGEHDPKPVVKLFNPCGAATWLLTELVPDSLGDDGEPDTAFGLCDLGQGFPELGYVSLGELRDVVLFNGALYIERDEWFTATQTLSQYAAEAKAAGRIAG